MAGMSEAVTRHGTLGLPQLWVRAAGPSLCICIPLAPGAGQHLSLLDCTRVACAAEVDETVSEQQFLFNLRIRRLLYIHVFFFSCVCSFLRCRIVRTRL